MKFLMNLTTKTMIQVKKNSLERQAYTSSKLKQKNNLYFVFLSLTLLISFHSNFAFGSQKINQEEVYFLLNRAIFNFNQGDYLDAQKDLEKTLLSFDILKIKEIIEIRKILGITYYINNQKDRSKEEFTYLLYTNPKFSLDPSLVAPKIVDFFNIVKKNEEDKLQEIEKIFSIRKKEFETPKVIEKKQIEKSRALAFFPFGIGQFQNGNKKLGALFLTIETVGLAANILGYFMGQLNANREGQIITNAQKRAHSAWLGVQYAGLCTFAIGWASSALEANLKFKPYIVIESESSYQKYAVGITGGF